LNSFLQFGTVTDRDSHLKHFEWAKPKIEGRRLSTEMKRIQTSIITVFEKENYEWVTLTVQENSNIK
jgi:hypothetical protein